MSIFSWLFGANLDKEPEIPNDAQLAYKVAATMDTFEKMEGFDALINPKTAIGLSKLAGYDIFLTQAADDAKTRSFVVAIVHLKECAVMPRIITAHRANTAASKSTIPDLVYALTDQIVSKLRVQINSRSQ